MRYSIFILLFFIYALLAVIAFYVARMMRREARLQSAGLAPLPEKAGPQSRP